MSYKSLIALVMLSLCSHATEPIAANSVYLRYGDIIGRIPDKDFINSMLSNSSKVSVKLFDSIPRGGTSVNLAYQAVKMSISVLPDTEMTVGLREYFKAVNFDAYSSDTSVTAGNEGIAQRSKNLFESNSCFRQKAIDFYSEILILDTKYISKRPTLKMVSGHGDAEALSPGWLWDLAMKHSRGDPGAAIALIGLCGHDDTSQGQYLYEVQESEKERAKSKFLKQIKDTRLEIKQLLKKTSGSAETKQLEAMDLHLSVVEKYAEKKDRVYQRFYCPTRSSILYLPQSLGEKVDISNKLKNKIVALQAPNADADRLPAKYYHVYGSALISCQMLEAGATPEATRTIAPMATKVYRTLHACNTTKKSLYAKEQLEQAYRQYAHFKKGSRTEREQSFHDFWMQITERAAKGEICKGELEPYNIYSTGLTIFTYNPKGEFGPKDTTYPCGTLSGILSGKVELLQRDFQRLERKIDGAQLYRDWYLGGLQIHNFTTPCAGIRIGGPADLENPRIKVRTNRGSTVEVSKPTDWSDARYEAAIDTLKTWEVDREWTAEQHRIGAEFAIQHCKKQEPTKDRFRGLCSENPNEAHEASLIDKTK